MAITKEQAIDILDKFDFFQGQRAGRELWDDKPFDVQEQDINNFSKDVALLKEYIADVVPKSEVEGIIAIRLRMQEKKKEKHDYALGVLDDLLNEKDEEIKQLRDDNQFLQDRRFKEWSEVRQEIAREIFEEIDQAIAKQYPIYTVKSIIKSLDYVKKKYTESEDKE